MNENCSNLSWYPLYSPTCTDSDLLQMTEQLSLDNSNNPSHNIPRITNVPSNVPSSESAVNVTRQRKTGASTLGTNVIEFTASEQTYKWHRKLSDSGPSAGGKYVIYLDFYFGIFANYFS